MRLNSYNDVVAHGIFWTCVVLAVVFMAGFVAGGYWCKP
jgi:uncharacterized membrane protein YciS (DUF1049 family)